ncbi:Neu5Ac permease [Alkalihalophilus pseudofirmus]|uniref:TRAP transporter large permease n=1 Tax=Alkalihalobacterium alkalinitrilicum TaxID=427920 RepID=UPI00094D4548|nr:TRAP transporter large permease subunit [Alkalihalobacterium alkalinitrilicum]OLO37861.1 Neu5Ac permease [Alkalihalophilus pseudofirmus]
MPDILLVAIVLILFFLLLLAGLYIHSILLAVGVIGLLLIERGNIIPGLVGSDPFNQATNYTLTTIPLFVLMAQFILNAGIVKDLFTIVYNISRGKKGLLGALTIIIGGFLGAVSGSGTATAASLGQVAVPELRNHGYKSELAGAIAAAGGSLSGIIPPSLILILFGVISETPVGTLFIGAIIPGILIMFVYIICMFILLARTDSKQEKGTVASFKPIKTSRIIVVFLVGFFISFIIFGGIYAGFVTPTEAGAVGAFAAFIAALILGRVNKDFIYKSFSETLKITGMVIIILIGAKIFSRFVSVSLLPRKLVESIGTLLEYPVIVLIILTFVFFILFMFIEGGAVILMTLPVVLPIVEMMNVDILWFGVFISVICTLGLITPPVGLSVYAVSGVSKIPLEGIFKYSTIFAVVVAIVVCGLLIIFPSLITWLPSTM